MNKKDPIIQDESETEEEIKNKKISHMDKLKIKIHDFVGGKEVDIKKFIQTVFEEFKSSKVLTVEKYQTDIDTQKNYLKSFNKIKLPCYCDSINMNLINLFPDLYLDFGNLSLIKESILDCNRLQLHLAPSGIYFNYDEVFNN
jgi:hypothetical protein